MEKRADALYKLLSDYGAEYRAALMLPYLLSFTALWLALCSKVAESSGDMWPLVRLIYAASALTLCVMSVGYLFHRVNRSRMALAWLILAKARGRKVVLLRHNDFRRLEAIELDASGAREPWSIYARAEGESLGEVLYRPVRLTVLQAHAVTAILNGPGD